MEFGRGNLALFLLGTVLVLCIEESTQNVPPEMWAQLKNINNTEDFIKNFLKKKPGKLHGPPGEQVGPDGSPDRPSAEQPVPFEEVLYTEEGALTDGGTSVVAAMLSEIEDKCEVKLASIPIPRDDNPNAIYWPPCIKLDQCNGCCNNEILHCVPTLVQAVSVEVMRAIYPHPGADYFEFDGIYSKVFEKHLGCQCECRVQPHHCIEGLHDYDPYGCKCRCFNEWESASCVAPKVWSNSECRCVCPDYGRDCYDDELYDELSCSCVPSDGMAQMEEENPLGNAPLFTARCDMEMSCRFGFVAVEINGECDCVVGSPDAMEGTLLDSRGRPTSGPRPGAPSPNIEVDIDRVPGHPQYVVRPHETTARPTRPPRQTRPPRPTRAPRSRSHNRRY